MKKACSLSFWSTTFLALTFINACGSKSDDKETTPVASTTSTYLYADAAPIISANCFGSGCHNTTAAKLTTLAEVKTAKASMITRINATNSTRMPPTGTTFVSSADGVKLLNWLAGGADLK